MVSAVVLSALTLGYCHPIAYSLQMLSLGKSWCVWVGSSSLLLFHSVEIFGALGGVQFPRLVWSLERI